MDLPDRRGPNPEPYYSDDEAKEILARAMALPEGDGFSRAQLAQFAEELGIAPAQLAAAEREWLAGRETQEESTARQAFIAERRREARNNVAGMVVMGGVVWLAMALSIPVLSGIATGLAAIIGVIGIFVFFQVWEAVFDTQGEDFDKDFDKWLERREKRRARLAPPRPVAGHPRLPSRPSDDT